VRGAGVCRPGQDGTEHELHQRDDCGRQAGDDGDPGVRRRPGPAGRPGQSDRDDSQADGGQPSVRPNCRTTAAWCPASAAVIDAPDAVSFGLGAATASPAIQDSV
jgi:hypothetical protein